MAERKIGYDPKKYKGTIDDIDALVGPAETSNAVNNSIAAFEPSTTMLSISHPIARGIMEATGLPTVVVEGNPGDTAEQQATMAAMTARDLFLPRQIGQIVDQMLEGEQQPQDGSKPEQP